MARTLDRPAQDALRGNSSGPPAGREPGSSRGGATRCMLLLGVEGHQGMFNDVIFKPALRRSPVVPPQQRTLVFFGGDVQNFLHLMDQNNPNKPANDWCLETTACRLGAGYPYHHIVVIKPFRIVLSDISCYDNFVPGNRVGAPTHTYHYRGMPHLEKLLKTISRKLKRMQTEELCEMLFKSDNEDEIVNVDQEENDDANKRIRLSVRQMEMYCWWQRRLRLHRGRLTLAAFSKGCVVLNQFLYEFHYARHLALQTQDSRFINRVEAMYWLDGGHPGQSNTWITARALLHTLTTLGICVHVHVSKYQVEDQTRPWIGKEEKEFVATLRTLGAMVFRHLHLYETTDLFAHFNVLAKFMDVEKNVGRQLTHRNSTFSDPGSGPSPSDSGSSQNSSSSDPQNPPPGSESPRSHHAGGGSSEPGLSDDYDAPINTHSIANLQCNDSSELTASIPYSGRFSNHFSGPSRLSNITDPSSSTRNIDPVSTLFPNLEGIVQIFLMKSLWELYFALYVLFALAGNYSKTDTKQLHTSKSPIEILSAAAPSQNCKINLAVPKIMVVPRSKTINTYSDIMIAPDIFEDSSVFSPLGINTVVRYNRVYSSVIRDNTSLVSFEYSNPTGLKINESSIAMGSDTVFAVPNPNIPTKASQQAIVNAMFHDNLPRASVSNAVTSNLESTGESFNAPPAPIDSDSITPVNSTSVTSSPVSACGLTASGPAMPSALVAPAPSTSVPLLRSPVSLRTMSLAAFSLIAPSLGLTTATSPVSFARLIPTSEYPFVTVSAALAASFSNISAAIFSTASSVPVSAGPSAPIFTSPGASVSTSTNFTTAPATLASIALAALVSSGTTSPPLIPQIRRPRRNSCSDLPSAFQPDNFRELRGNSMPSDIDYFANLAAPSNNIPPHDEAPVGDPEGSAEAPRVVRRHALPLVEYRRGYVYFKFDFDEPRHRRPGRRRRSLRDDSEDESASSDSETFWNDQPDQSEWSEFDVELAYAHDEEPPAAVDEEPSV